MAAKGSFAVVVVEGGPKALKFYKKLMLKRMKWHITVEAEKARAEGEGEDEPAAAEDEEGEAPILYVSAPNCNPLQRAAGLKSCTAECAL